MRGCLLFRGCRSKSKRKSPLNPVYYGGEVGVFYGHSSGKFGGDEFGTYIDNNASGIVNYGERHRCGERISTGFVESTINQLVAKRFVKKQQMRWTPRGAHLLLQIRVQALNDDLRTSFERWYPDLRREETLAA